MRSRGSRGASSTEYALLIALLGGVLCVGVATLAKDVFENGVCSFGRALGADFCAGSGLESGPPPGGGPTDEPSVLVTHPRPTPSTTPSCLPSVTPTSSASGSPQPSPTCATASG